MEDREGPIEIAVVGDISEHESDLFEKLLSVEPGGRCVIYFDSLGGSAYAAVALASAIRLRGVKATGIVVGECASAALWPFAACRHRLVTPLSVLLFHPMKWQSEENVALAEAAEWARHFGSLETSMDAFLADLFGTPVERIREWSYPGRYVSGKEMAEAGLAELVDLKNLPGLRG
ncbi:MAG: ATP-dependent Clp protease proteolytic subunit [Pirellulales bacterium]|nr:ATP-dependent Clp protease proteolytic subunit [Pirellulales bacterium]